MSNYKVVPFVAVITKSDTTSKVAEQLEALVNQQASQGWEYVRLESVETHIEGDKGCFGFGATPGHNTVFSMVVFKR